MTTFTFTLTESGIEGDYSDGAAKPGIDKIIIRGEAAPHQTIHSFVDAGHGTWSSRGRMGDRALRMLTFDLSKGLWSMDVDGNVARWSHAWDTSGSWDTASDLGRSQKMIVFDPREGAGGLMWRVDDQSRAGYWRTWDHPAPYWFDEGCMAGWCFKMLAFDRDTTMWCVDTNGHAGELLHLSDGTWCWSDHGAPAGEALCWIAFDTTNLLWGITDRGDFYSWERRHKRWMRMGRVTDLLLTALVFPPDPNQVWCIDSSGDVVQWKDASVSLAGVTSIELNREYTIPAHTETGLYYLTPTPFPLEPGDGKREATNGKLNVGSK